MTTPASEPANDSPPPTRPASFDARIMAYLPGLRKHSRRYRKDQDARADLVTDTVIHCLTNWHNFREDGGLWLWLCWHMRGVASNQKQYAERRNRKLKLVSSDYHYINASTPARQFDYAELSDVLRQLPNGRESAIVVRRSMGDELHEIGDDLGVSAERVRQLEERGRVAIRKRMRVRGVAA